MISFSYSLPYCLVNITFHLLGCNDISNVILKNNYNFITRCKSLLDPQLALCQVIIQKPPKLQKLPNCKPLGSSLKPLRCHLSLVRAFYRSLHSQQCIQNDNSYQITPYFPFPHVILGSRGHLKEGVDIGQDTGTTSEDTFPSSGIAKYLYSPCFSPKSSTSVESIQQLKYNHMGHHALLHHPEYVRFCPIQEKKK